MLTAECSASGIYIGYRALMQVHSIEFVLAAATHNGVSLRLLGLSQELYQTEDLREEILRYD